ncbi:MgtC/SapB family protein [Luteimonas kalidii]|uniref:MgtC/SapB family protein n=1 Tax=Luteimonas kalidii TaxID=3042025 RepID=A0ABT6JWD0_9GAMM|nr:MgtC/SapB family protein [Luteimonas kalidii]MDH5834985.1 MgtC/SapB family protein [Luteimonas kalidii]
MSDAADLPLLSLTTALGAGLLIGLLYERRKEDDPAIAAGLRTHTLVALAGAIAAWIGLPVFIVVLLLTGTFAALSYLRTSQTDTGVTAEVALICSALWADWRCASRARPACSPC